ncbi:MAG: glucosaminidase domain-containing protein [Bacteroidaceae bacterium]|nr:glucosaminidase domain-containing protein [Bacteroidaceae bacterium]
MKNTLFSACIAWIWLLSSAASAQRSPQFEAYIERFAPVAVAEMQAHGIPASITLAQGLLESGAGKSVLATRGNNHFGIKAGSDWHGPYMLKDDDAPNERFRVYADAAESYADHSLFLSRRGRYSSLFELPITDYRSWAHGLKAAGYATSPTYAERLIQLIETYDLTRFDKPTSSQTAADATTARGQHDGARTTQTRPASQSSQTVAQRGQRVKMENGAYYVEAQAGDTYQLIAQRWGVRRSALRRYNEVRKGYEPAVGERVYLVQKKVYADKRYKGRVHVVQPNESLHLIAQRYGMRTRSLYKLNKLSTDYIPTVGDQLRLR